MSTRYYNPEVGRFLNADAFASTGQGLLGNNMFAYCLNKPTCYADSTGNRCVPAGRGGDMFGKAPVTDPNPAPTPEEQTYGVVNGQDLLPYADEKIGWGTYGKSGCAYIATYNAMQLIGDPQSLQSVVDEMFWYGAVAFGAGGAGPWATSKYLKKHGINYTGSFSVTELTENISEGSVVVFTAMYPGGWHAMAALYTDGEYWVFNRSNKNASHVPYSSLDEAFSNGWWIYGMRIDP